MYTIVCTAYFYTHFPVSSPSLFEYNGALRYINEAYAIYGTYLASQAPVSGFSRQEYWSGLPFLSPGGLSWPRDGTRISCLAVRFFTTELPGKPTEFFRENQISDITVMIMQINTRGSHILEMVTRRWVSKASGYTGKV